jgi:hypothetical protein
VKLQNSLPIIALHVPRPLPNTDAGTSTRRLHSTTSTENQNHIVVSFESIFFMVVE